MDLEAQCSGRGDVTEVVNRECETTAGRTCPVLLHVVSQPKLSCRVRSGLIGGQPKGKSGYSMSNSGTEKKSGVVPKVMQILEAFDDKNHFLQLSHIIERTQIPRSTCHRLLAEMVDVGLLDKVGGRRYCVGRKLWTTAMRTPLQRTVRDVALPYMQDLLRATGQVVNLLIPEGDSVVVLERISGTSVGEPVRKSGEYMPMHTSAGGKVLMAHADEAIIARVVEHLEPETSRSITDPKKLLQELEDIRQQGWAQSQGEHHPNTRALAVPVYSPEGQVEAAVGVVYFVALTEPQPVLSALRVVSGAITRQLRQRL